ncbi:serine hydrolase domain-containing protein [Aquisalimonas asiatica]|uniref:CubicO group peptidase, beta-lactamase class C family n=1 Tax=Aquisalimonas asiatica TaxID=406100 RepID=A0A1H8PUB7_9GAMM|nr:serine hydrolase [Aquisalimonas asiatica]SEO45540.1 CubicO group peptidase, beta-lactamase class C family [Aquisalimonas asiatica]
MNRPAPLLSGVLLLLGLLALSVLWWGPIARDFAAAGTGYGAKQLCSGVFVSGRDPLQVLDKDLGDLPAVISAHANPETGTVTASLGPLTRKAYYRDGLGCTLAAGGTAPSPMPVTATDDGDTPATLPAVDHNAPRRLALGPMVEAAFSEPLRDQQRGTRALVIVHQGQIVAERYAPGFDADMPLPGWSMAKSVTNALTGILVRDGYISLDDTLPEWRDADDGRASITVRHLLQMTSGLAFEEDYADPLGDPIRMLFNEPDAAAFVRSKGLDAEPGMEWEYTSGTTNLLMAVLRGAIDDDTAWAGFPREALFQPLGMDSAVLEPDASGTFVGSSFMLATARDWARFGQLYLQDGKWNGERLLPEDWVAFTREPAPDADKGGYGAHFWLNRGDPDTGERPWPELPADTYAASGYQGQEVVIVPSADLVVVRLGLSRPREAWDREWFVSGVLDLLGGE